MTTYTFADALLPDRNIEIGLKERGTGRGSHVVGGVLMGLLPTAVAIVGVVLGQAWLGHVAYKVLLLVVPLAVGWRLRAHLTFPRSSIAPAVLSGLSLGAAAAIGLVFLLPTLRDPALIRAGLDARYALTPAFAITFALFNMSVNAILEEIFYRGLLAPRLGAFLSTALFALQHAAILTGPAGLPAALAAGGATFLAGFVWYRLAQRHGLTSAAVSHIAADLVVLTTGLRLLGYL